MWLIEKYAEDIEKLREMRGTNGVIEVVEAKLNETESLLEAFDGCCGVFHTAMLIDPGGLSGYSVSFFLFLDCF